MDRCWGVPLLITSFNVVWNKLTASYTLLIFYKERQSIALIDCNFWKWHLKRFHFLYKLSFVNCVNTRKVAHDFIHFFFHFSTIHAQRRMMRIGGYPVSKFSAYSRLTCAQVWSYCVQNTISTISDFILLMKFADGNKTFVTILYFQTRGIHTEITD